MTQSPAIHSPMHPVAVGHRLRALRMHYDQKKGEFAKSVGIDATSYGRIEKGDKALNAEMAFRIAERWGVSMDYLYRGRLTELPPSLADNLMSHLTKPQE